MMIDILISEEFILDLGSIPKMTDEEFMLRQIWQLKHVFHNEIAAIKNIKCEFIAFTKYFAEEFSVDFNLLGKTAIAIASDFENEVYNDILKQENDIINKGEVQDSLYLYKHNDVVSIYAVRKRPMINPSTGNVAGIMLNTAKFMPNSLRKVLDEQVLNILHQDDSNILDKGLSKLQQQIVFCLLLGFSSRKEITNTLISFTVDTPHG